MRTQSAGLSALLSAVLALAMVSTMGPAGATTLAFHARPSSGPIPARPATNGGIRESALRMPRLAAVTPRQSCPSSHPQPLTVRAQTTQELAYLDDIDACTNFLGTQTWLNNRSDLVWIPRILPAGGRAWDLNVPATTFMSALGVTDAIIVPGDAVIVGGPPAQVEWRFDLSMSAAWEGRNYLLGWAIDNGLAWGFANRRTTVGATVATCLWLAKNAVYLKRDLVANNQVAPSTLIGNVLSTGVLAGTCGQRLTSLADYYGVQTPKFWRDMTSLELTRLRSADALMARMQRLQRAIALLTLG